MNGIVIVDKPAGWTSQDVTARLRRVFGTRRIGHGGTLDPMATGVLPVFVGRATRGVEFFEHAEKEYEATLLLGVTTDTQDVTGNVLDRQEVSLSREALLRTLPDFTGDILQIPPMYSALKVGGRKLCDLARAGKEIVRAPRPVTVYSLECTEFDGKRAGLRVHCSKGTYVRTLCHDLGQALGCGGCMESLRRTRAGSFTLEDAVPLEELITAEDPGKFLREVASLFDHLPALTLTARQEKQCRNGAAFSLSAPWGEYRAYSLEGEFLALVRVEDGKCTTVKSFFDPEGRP